MKTQTLVEREQNPKVLVDSTRAPADRFGSSTCESKKKKTCDDTVKRGIENSTSSETVSMELPRRTAALQMRKRSGQKLVPANVSGEREYCSS